MSGGSRSRLGLAVAVAAGLSCLSCIPGSLSLAPPDATAMDSPATTDAREGGEADARVEATSDAAVEAPSDAAADACVGPGCPCTTPSSCAAGLFCVDPSVLGGLGNVGAFCSRTCCTSADCAPGFVCYGSGDPGNYCVEASLLSGRGTLGAAPGGAPCNTGGDCRSGICMGGCLDTCCSDRDCTSMTACVLDRTAVDGHEGFRCQVPTGTTPGGGSCTSGTQCISNSCLAIWGCGVPCCGNASCQAGNCAVVQVLNAGDYVAECFPADGGSPGSRCASDSDCASGACNPTTGMCADRCCVDADCAASGFVCRPTQSASHALICAPSM